MTTTTEPLNLTILDDVTLILPSYLQWINGQTTSYHCNQRVTQDVGYWQLMVETYTVTFDKTDRVEDAMLQCGQFRADAVHDVWIMVWPISSKIEGNTVTVTMACDVVR